MKKLIFPALVAGLFAASCAKKEAPAETTTAIEDSVKVEATDSISTPEKVGISGTYEGKIPGADVAEVEFKLTLNDDKTFSVEENFIGKENGKFSNNGTFEVSEDGEFITLKEDNPRVFYITEGAVFLVEKVGDKNTKEEYKLSKK